MVRFFFDLSKDGVLSRDDSGLEFASDEVAKTEATKALLAMALSGLAGIQRGSMAMAVRDEYGASICTASLALSVIDA